MHVFIVSPPPLPLPTSSHGRRCSLVPQCHSRRLHPASPPQLPAPPPSSPSIAVLISGTSSLVPWHQRRPSSPLTNSVSQPPRSQQHTQKKTRSASAKLGRAKELWVDLLDATAAAPLAFLRDHVSLGRRSSSPQPRCATRPRDSRGNPDPSSEQAAACNPRWRKNSTGRAHVEWESSWRKMRCAVTRLWCRRWRWLASSLGRGQGYPARTSLGSSSPTSASPREREKAAVERRAAGGSAARPRRRIALGGPTPSRPRSRGRTAKATKMLLTAGLDLVWWRWWRDWRHGHGSSGETATGS